MKIEKLPSGSYRIRLQENGKRYSITVPYNPKTEKNAYKLIREHIDNPGGVYDTMTLDEASDKYIEIKSNVLSPSTIRGYKSIKNCLPDKLLKAELRSITQLDIQGYINTMSKDCSPKTIRNVHGFISAVLGTFYPSMVINTTLPQKVRKSAYTPSEGDVKALLKHCEPTQYFVPLYLASLGLRRSEICALSLADLNGNRLTINKALVQNSDKKFVIKRAPKTDASNREIIIPDILANRIREQGYVYKGYPNAIDNYLRRNLPKLGIPIFSLHKLRHFFASYTHANGFSDATIQSLGGWSTDYVMKEVYRHAMEQEKQKENVADKMSSLFS